MESKRSLGGGDEEALVRLGGVRGLSKIVTIQDILEGYGAGRELSAAFIVEHGSTSPLSRATGGILSIRPIGQQFRIVTLASC
jgi:hypothetical protein